MWLSKELVTSVQDKVRVFYVSWAAAQQWNGRRDKDVPRVFTGWYWVHGRQEAGPFKSMSSCYRDAWYSLVTDRSPPKLYRLELEHELPTRRKRIIRKKGRTSANSHTRA